MTKTYESLIKEFEENNPEKPMPINLHNVLKVYTIIQQWFEESGMEYSPSDIVKTYEKARNMELT